MTNPAWTPLFAHGTRLETTPLGVLLKDEQRNQRLRHSLGGCLIDFSRQHVDLETLQSLAKLTRESGVYALRDALFSEQNINLSEDRAVLHPALRDGIEGLSSERAEAIAVTRDRLYALAESLRCGSWRGSTGKAIEDVVHIGIGGSHLGPELLVRALEGYQDSHLRFHFVANIDAGDLSAALRHLNPETTLFIVVSKSFGTLETQVNAASARSWFLERTGEVNALAQHFIGITAKVDAAQEFGIPQQNIYPLWDWVGGRFSLWSAVGLPVLLAIGPDHFDALLRGARTVDRHFLQTSDLDNLPALNAALAFWNFNILGCTSLAILCYDERLALLPDYLQQLEMESNGKSVNRHGNLIDYPTMPILWGGTGCNGQHAYHQLLHQGTSAYAADFVLVGADEHQYAEHHRWLNANAIAQGQAMAMGFVPQGSGEEHRRVSGGHPSTTIILDQLGPQEMGALLAIYEHKVLSLGALWDINSFDQWGVELGKNLARPIFAQLEDVTEPDNQDQATGALIKHLQKVRQ